MTNPAPSFVRRKLPRAARQKLVLGLGFAAALALLLLGLASAMSPNSAGHFSQYVFVLGATAALFTFTRSLAARLATKESEDTAASRREFYLQSAAMICAALVLAFGRLSGYLALAGLTGLGAVWLLRMLSGLHFGAASQDERERPRYRENSSVDTLAGLVVAVLGIVVAYGYGLRAFQIPTGSMEPTLYGASGSGERAIVNLAPSHTKRGDITIFRYPLGRGQDYVKRNIAQGGDLLVIHLGDVYLQRAGQSAPTIWRKQGLLRESLWLPQMSFEGSRAAYESYFGGIKGKAEMEDHAFVLAAGDEAEAACRYPKDGVLRNHDPSTDVDPERAALHSTEKVLDARIRAELTIPEGASAELRFVGTSRKLILRLEAGKSASLTLTQGAQPPSQHESSLQVPAGKVLHIEAALADGRASLKIDGESFEFDFVTPLEAEMAARASSGTLDEFLTRLGGAGFSNNKSDVEALNAQGLHLEFVAQGGSVSFGNVRVDRDVHYLGRRLLIESEHGIAGDNRVSHPYVHRVRENGYFMLGDHSEDSLDSRAWFEVSVKLADQEWRFPLNTMFPPTSGGAQTRQLYVNLQNALNAFSTPKESEAALAAFEKALRAGHFGGKLELVDIFGITRRFDTSAIQSVEVKAVPDVPKDLLVGPLLGSVFPRPRFIN